MSLRRKSPLPPALTTDAPHPRAGGLASTLDLARRHLEHQAGPLQARGDVRSIFLSAVDERVADELTQLASKVWSQLRKGK